MLEPRSSGLVNALDQYADMVGPWDVGLRHVHVWRAVMVRHHFQLFVPNLADARILCLEFGEHQRSVQFELRICKPRLLSNRGGKLGLAYQGSKVLDRSHQSGKAAHARGRAAERVSHDIDGKRGTCLRSLRVWPQLDPQARPRVDV